MMDSSNQLYVYPSDGPGSLPIQEKFIGAQNYRSSKRSIEIGLSTKRKLGFVKVIQQEESQKDVFNSGLPVIESTALLSKSVGKDKCSMCDFKWHPPDKCWEKVVYPVWHYKYKNQGRTNQSSGDCTDDELEFVAGMICLNAATNNALFYWILDTGATYHMTPYYRDMINAKILELLPKITLPNRDSSEITQFGQVRLQNGIVLKDVLCVHTFKFSLLSVPKLTKDNNCVAIFFLNLCVIHDLRTRKVQGLGRKIGGLYHLLNVSTDQVVAKLRMEVKNSTSLFSCLAGFEEAVKDPGWCDVMNAELRALEENGTWELVDLPPNKKVIVQGNRQMRGVDYDETFAPVAKMVIVRSLLAVAAMQGWDITQMNVSNAFLHGDLFDDVYMYLTMGYVRKGDNIQDSKLSTSKVCKLKKSLYGLNQAPRQWFAKLSNALLSFGYKQSKADYSLFTKTNAEGFTAVLVYVDDLMITGSDSTQIDLLKSQLRSQFYMKDLGALHYFWGLEVTKADFGLFVAQKKYTLEMLQDDGVLNSRPYKLPMDPNLKLHADVGTPLQDPEVYRS
nr:retrovirus-related Pol polyprotein from transposon TNT 1-94 [Tanacetum cinerariifolium]